MKICLWALAFVPLVVADSVFFPYISGKSLLIRLAITLVAVLFVIHFSFNKFFRNEISSRIQKLKKNPLVVSLFVFMTLFVVSVIFAFDKYRAFYGDVERGEGLVGTLFFFGFFIFSLLLFTKKDWLWFFKLNLFTGIILFIKQYSDFAGGAQRPGAYTGNPTFLAGYMLFVIACGAIVYFNAKNESSGLKIFWRIVSVLSILAAIAGIFIAETRGTILGLVAGLVAVIVYGGTRGHNVRVFKTNFRKISLVLLALMIIVAGGFFITRSNSIWQKVPGLNRLAQIGSSDVTTDTRLIALGVSLKAINPQLNGMGKFLLGWGWENYRIAYSTNYNPLHYKLEHEWFDRAHNKLMDVLVMNGALGLLSYLAVWISFLWLIFRRKEFSYDKAAVLFFGVALFVHLLVVFDQISTYIPFFAALAFLVFSYSMGETDSKAAKQEIASTKNLTAYALFTIAALFALWSLIFATIVPYAQMSAYLGMMSTGDPNTIAQNIDSVFSPYTYAQGNIRTHFLSSMLSYYGKDPTINKLMDKAISKMEELVQKEPNDPRQFILIGQAYEAKGKVDGNMDLFKKAEGYYREAYTQAPMRPDMSYPLALNLFYQKRYDEAIALLRKTLGYDNQVPETNLYLGEVLAFAGEQQNHPEYYSEALGHLEFALNKSAGMGNDKAVIAIYNSFAKYFYDKRDKEDFITVSKRLAALQPDKAQDFAKIIEMLNNGQWPSVNFQ